MAGFVFNTGALRLLTGSTVWGTSPIYARLVPTADAALDITAGAMTDIGSADATATAIVANPVGPGPWDLADNRLTFRSDNQVFPTVASLVGECNRIVFFEFGTEDADSIPIAYCDITPITPTGGDVTVTMDAIGWFYIAMAEESDMLPDIYEYSYTLTDAQIKALATPTSVEVLPAPGIGFVWQIVQLNMIIDASAGAYGNFTDLAYVELTHSRSDNLVNDASVGFTQLTDFFGYAGVNYASLRGQFSTEADSTFAAPSGYGNINKVVKDVDADENNAVSIQIAGNTGALTGGNAANTLKIRVLAMKIAL